MHHWLSAVDVGDVYDISGGNSDIACGNDSNVDNVNVDEYLASKAQALMTQQIICATEAAK